MVLQVLAHTGQVHLRGNAQRAQPLAIANARQLQQLRCIDGAGADDHLAPRPHLAPHTILQVLHTAGVAALDQNAQRLATIATGYADGWPRSLGGKGAAWYRGVRLPIVGRISMDSLTVDIGGVAEADISEGDFVELLGLSQSVADVARDAGTIGYEILTGLGKRHARFVIENGQMRNEHNGEAA